MPDASKASLNSYGSMDPEPSPSKISNAYYNKLNSDLHF